MEGLNSNLNLNAQATPRVQPRLGEWGPLHVPSTKQKRRQRWWVLAALVAATVAIVLVGGWVFTQLR